VGRTQPGRAWVGGSREHPHMRGEDGRMSVEHMALVGTPPHAWGRHRRARRPSGKPGNTPTCVGKTHPQSPQTEALAEHPHMRGEDGGLKDWSVQLEGTPPHAWGRLNRHRSGVPRLRNTPTCVGKTAECVCSFVCSREHPHMRGEDRKRPALLHVALHNWTDSVRKLHSPPPPQNGTKIHIP